MKEIMKQIIRQEMQNKPLGPFLETEQSKENTLSNCLEGYADEFTNYSLAQRHENFPRVPLDPEEEWHDHFDNYCDAMLEVLCELYPEHKEVWVRQFA